MLDGNDLLNIIKKAALEAAEAGQPSDFCFGKVTSTSPLKILVEQKMTLSVAQLVLTRNVTDFETNVTVNWGSESALNTHTHKVEGTDSSGDDINLTSDITNLAHNHELLGKKKITVHNALMVGDNVVLLKQKGGQKYLVLDKVVGA